MTWSTAWAQAASSNPPEQPASVTQPALPTPSTPQVVSGEDGFAIESASGDFRLQLGMLLHADARFAVDDVNDQYVDNFSLRRVRAYLRGRFARRFEFYLNPDFAGGTVVVQDAYVDTVFSPPFRIRAGKGKTPFGMERLHSVSNLMFMERALPTALVPNRDVGVQLLGDVAGGAVSYMAGVMNGVADGASADVDTNDGKDVSGRLVFRPFRRHEKSLLRGLGLGLSGSAGSGGSLPAFRTQTLQQPFFSYSSSSSAPVVADGTRTRYSPQVWYFHKAFGGWGEYVRTETPLHSNAVAAEIAHTAWQVAATWMLTGENATDAASGVKPHANFDFAHGNWGAFQIAARYHVLEVDDRAISLNFATPGSSPKAEAWTVGLRWYLTRNFSYTVNFERTVFDGNPDARRNAENALAFRAQVSF